ncbi:MAG: hypothetical protein JNL32_06920 [Candidatus Kapabacteria bacterium]|nr:hypothetical protein [Candidatus Kapabacteria bacterium]
MAVAHGKVGKASGSGGTCTRVRVLDAACNANLQNRRSALPRTTELFNKRDALLLEVWNAAICDDTVVQNIRTFHVG